METANGFLGENPAVAGNDACHIDRQKTAAANCAGEGEDQQRQRQHEDGRQPAVSGETVDDGGDHDAAEQAENHAKPHLLDEKQQKAAIDAGQPRSLAMISTVAMVRKIAIGSLVPDSTSSVERT